MEKQLRLWLTSILTESAQGKVTAVSVKEDKLAVHQVMGEICFFAFSASAGESPS